jgi:hypothetical protein
LLPTDISDYILVLPLAGKRMEGLATLATALIRVIGVLLNKVDEALGLVQAALPGKGRNPRPKLPSLKKKK